MTVRRLPTALALLATLVALAAGSATAFAAGPGHVSFSLAQQTFMCTICHEPLNEAHSPEAFQENGYLRQLITRGESMPAIKRDMVAQYGTGVLADPPKKGFAILIVVIPVAVIALALLIIAYTIPRWRRRAADQAAEAQPAAPSISREDAARLDADLARQN